MSSQNSTPNEPKTLSDAINRLEEAASRYSTNDLRSVLEKDLREVKAALDTIKPYVEQLKARASSDVREAGHQVDAKVRENPWAAMGLVGLATFLIGLILGRDRK